jgi:hypothetical protein
MQITTKFNVGDSVVFLHKDTFTRREIVKIHIEVNAYSPIPATALIMYYFKDLHRDQYSNSEVYKYETELAKTKAELAELMSES